MKYLVIFVLCFIAVASAAPQLIIPGGVTPTLGGTVVAGPTVVNGLAGVNGLTGLTGVGALGLGRVIAPGVLGVGII